MKNIEGVEIAGLGFVSQKMGDLIEHEGPLLSLFIDQNNPGNYFLYKWADCNEVANRWIVFQVSSNNLKRFFDKEVSLRKLFLEIPYSFIVDVDDELNERKISIAATNKLPEEYLPSANSLYCEEKFTEFANAFKTVLSNSNISPILDRILMEISSIKQNQNNTSQILNSLLSVKKSA